MVGDPARQDLFVRQMDSARVVASRREFKTVTGFFKDLPVTVITAGMGAPAAVLVLEELSQLGAKTVVRAGTGMAIGIPLGNFILVQAAARFEGTSPSYLPLNFPAVPDFDLFLSYFNTLHREAVPLSCGLILSSDNFYRDLFSSGPTHQSTPRDREGPALLEKYVDEGITSADMETSAMYVAARHLGIRCLSLLVATVDPFRKSTLEDGVRQRKETELCRLALEGLVQFAKRGEGNSV